MAKKISDLSTAAKPLSGGEVVPMNQNGVTVTASLSDVKSYTLDNGILGDYPPAVGWIFISGAGDTGMNGYYLPAYVDESENTVFARVDSSTTPIESSYPYPVSPTETVSKTVEGWKIYSGSQAVYECTTDESSPSDGEYISVEGVGIDPAPIVESYTTQGLPYFRCLKLSGGENDASPLYILAADDTGARTWLSVDLKGINGFTKTNVYNSSLLPDPSGLEGVRLIANHVDSPIFGEVVIPSGMLDGVTVPVYCDGTNWRVG